MGSALLPYRTRINGERGTAERLSERAGTLRPDPRHFKPLWDNASGGERRGAEFLDLVAPDHIPEQDRRAVVPLADRSASTSCQRSS
jgi:hypothetical protein